MTAELAQVNISRLLTPLDSPQLKEFVDALDPVNAVADAAPGFRWRLQGEEGDATAIRVFDDDWLIVNMSVWESPKALLDYVYGDAHRAILRGRRQWFHHPAEAMTALWWVPAGHRPSVAEAEERLVHLREHGPTFTAFTLKQISPAPEYLGAEPGKS
ncbi:DUF3291 domain-containing protein [Lentzea sp. NPDC051213]|uniref:DUF3291 domain-containing protein n=1 Tax=Lentzea sp. NPDC051213 TaxID=3364126 RepID=UPI0037B095AD